MLEHRVNLQLSHSVTHTQPVESWDYPEAFFMLVISFKIYTIEASEVLFGFQVIQMLTATLYRQKQCNVLICKFQPIILKHEKTAFSSVFKKSITLTSILILSFSHTVSLPVFSAVSCPPYFYRPLLHACSHHSIPTTHARSHRLHLMAFRLSSSL